MYQLKHGKTRTIVITRYTRLNLSNTYTIVGVIVTASRTKRRWCFFDEINNLNSKNMCRDIFLCLSTLGKQIQL